MDIAAFFLFLIIAIFFLYPVLTSWLSNQFLDTKTLSTILGVGQDEEILYSLKISLNIGFIKNEKREHRSHLIITTKRLIFSEIVYPKNKLRQRDDILIDNIEDIECSMKQYSTSKLPHMIINTKTDSFTLQFSRLKNFNKIISEICKYILDKSDGVKIVNNLPMKHKFGVSIYK